MVKMENATINGITYEGQCAENVGAAIEKIVNFYLKFFKTQFFLFKIFQNSKLTFCDYFWTWFLKTMRIQMESMVNR